MIGTLIHKLAKSVAEATSDGRHDAKVKKLAKLAARQQKQIDKLTREISTIRGALQNVVNVMTVMGERIAAMDGGQA